MAKLNLSSNEENPYLVSIFGSLGVLTCLIVSVLGIKLWWFKHRLSFEQTTIQNGAAGGATPNVVTRREKKTRFSKDKRWSQQVYHNVEVHGVFKQKKEDDSLIEGPAQLPPVRIRQAESAPSLLLPPPRNKRRPQYVQSTAFEELSESYTQTTATPTPSYSQENVYDSPMPITNNFPPATTNIPASTANLEPTFSNSFEVEEKVPEISLKFEEVEKDFELPNLRQENAVIRTEVPVPPKRINRSSSTSAKQQSVQEKPHRFLKSSQSVSVPEFRKVIERRPTGFHRPDEIDDLTKIDDLDEPQFEKFGDRRPTGYIKYEEVDFQAALRDYRPEEVSGFYDSGHLESQRYMEPIEALRDEEIVYKIPTSPDICEINETIEKYEKSTKERGENYNNLSKTYYGDEEVGTDFGKSNMFSKWQSQGDFFGKENNFPKIKEVQTKPQENWTNNRTNQNDSFSPQNFNKELESVEYLQDLESQRIVSFEQTSNDNEILEKSTLNQRRPTAYVRNENNFESEEKFQEKLVSFEQNSSETEDLEKSTLNQRRLTAYERNETRFESDEETESFEIDLNEKSITNRNQNGEMRQQNVHFVENAQEDKFTLNQRRPTEFVRMESEEEWAPQSVSFEVNLKESAELEEKFTLNQRRPTEYNRTTFDFETREIQEQSVHFKDLQQNDDNQDKFTLNQRRPTAFVISMEEEEEEANLGQTVRFEKSFENDKFTLNQRRPTAYVRAEEQYSPEQSVRFDHSFAVEGEEEKFTLNQRRATEFVRLPQEEYEDMGSETKVTFENSWYSETNEDKFSLNQLRPTGFISKQQEIQNEEPNWGNKVKFDLKENNLYFSQEGNGEMEDKFTLNQRRPTKYNHSAEDQEIINNISYAQEMYNSHLKEDSGTTDGGGHDLLKSHSNQTKAENHDLIWQELEKDIERDFVQNIEEEFARIRQSFELNEADFLELKDDLQLNSPTQTTPKVQSSLQPEDKPNGFGKSIDDDWENFEKLKAAEKNVYDLERNHAEDILITYNEEQAETGITTVSILKETKLEYSDSDPNSNKPRKSKVTFDFKTEEHLIPARTSPSDEDDYSDEDYDEDDIYDKPPPPIPMQRLTSLNYAEENFYEPVVVPPTTISLFGSLSSPNKSTEEDLEDSWSAIRQHRHMTSQFHSLSLDSSRSPPPSYPPPPLPAIRGGDKQSEISAPKPAYRNPMAQLAIQRSKEVRSDLQGVKSRSIKNAKKRSSQEFVNLRDDFDDTEA